MHEEATEALHAGRISGQLRVAGEMDNFRVADHTLGTTFDLLRWFSGYTIRATLSFFRAIKHVNLTRMPDLD